MALSLGCMLQLGRSTPCLQNVAVRAAAAQVAAHRAHDLLVGRRGCRIQQRPQAHDLARRAEPALEGVGLNERSLDRIKSVVAGQPFHGRDLPSCTIDGEQ